MIIVLQTERLRALTERGLVAFSREKNLRDLQSECIELADALAKLIDGRPGAEELAALEAADVCNMLPRLRKLVGETLWHQCQDIKLAKAERKVSEAEAAREAPSIGL